MAFDDLDVESLAIIANEAAEEVESSARKTVEHAERCGRALIAAKEKLPHGKFAEWLGSNFDYSERHAQRYMHIASNTTRVADLKNATSIREALRMIAEDPSTPKRDRKPSVEVIEPPILNDPRKPQKPQEPTGETATLAVSREETRKAPMHRPPEKFTPVTPSYEDEEDDSENDGSPVVEERRDMLDMFEDMKQIVREAMHEFPANVRASVWRQMIEQLQEEDILTW